MKLIIQVFLSVIICFAVISCENKSKNEVNDRKLALQQKVDSLSNTDVKLSFMGIDIGGDINKIEEAINQGKIDNVVDSNGVYIGNVMIPYDKYGTKVKSLIRIMTIDKKVAAIELLFKNQYASRFFVETFQERYYNDDELENNFFQRYSYVWSFKEQYVRVWNKTHEEPTEVITNGEYNIEKVNVYDATYVEYFHRHLYDIILEKANKEKVAKDSTNKVRQDSIENVNRMKEKEIKNNI